jgi:hypothetical protein
MVEENEWKKDFLKVKSKRFPDTSLYEELKW